MASQFASGKVPVLTRKLNAADSTAYLDSDVGITSGRLYLSNNLQEEWLSFSGVAASGSEYAYSGLVRGLSQTADPSTAGTGKTWLAGQQCALVEMHDQMFNKQRPEPKIFATTAARDSALGADGAATSPWVNVYVTDTALHYNYNLGTNQWEAIDTGTVTPNASTTVAGKVEIATQAEVTNGTTTGGTGAILAVSPDQLIQEVNGSTAKVTIAQADKIPLADSADSGIRKAITWANMEAQLTADYPGAFGGQDGDISWALTITGSNNTLIVKRYRNFAPGANTVTITPTGCVTVIKVSGNLDLTGTTINYAGKGMPGWSGSTWFTPGSSGGAQYFLKDTAPAWTIVYAGWFAWGAGGGGNMFANGGDGGDAWTNLWGAGGSVASYASKIETWASPYSDLLRYVAQWGAGGGAYQSSSHGTAGGAGGGTLVFIVSGNVTLSSTTVTVAGADGVTNTSHWTGFADSYLGGAGGGGSGGFFAIFYGWTLTGSVTPTVTGWTGGSVYKNDASPIIAAAGGAGGARRTNGANWTNGNNSEYCGAGGGGAGGDYIIAQI